MPCLSLLDLTNLCVCPFLGLPLEMTHTPLLAFLSSFGLEGGSLKVSYQGEVSFLSAGHWRSGNFCDADLLAWKPDIFLACSTQNCFRNPSMRASFRSFPSDGFVIASFRVHVKPCEKRFLALTLESPLLCRFRNSGWQIGTVFCGENDHDPFVYLFKHLSGTIPPGPHLNMP